MARITLSPSWLVRLLVGRGFYPALVVFSLIVLADPARIFSADAEGRGPSSAERRQARAALILGPLLVCVAVPVFLARAGFKSFFKT